MSCLLVVIHNPANALPRGSEQDCAKPCDLTVKPVCAKNKSGVYTPFINQCVYEVNKCKKPTENWVPASSDKCKPLRLRRDVITNQLKRKCLRGCSVGVHFCAKDQFGGLNRFRSACDQRVYNCLHPEFEFTKLDSLEPCRVSKCEWNCTDIAHPVCGRNDEQTSFQEFVNSCFLEKHACENKEANWKETELKKCRK